MPRKKAGTLSALVILLVEKFLLINIKVMFFLIFKLLSGTEDTMILFQNFYREDQEQLFYIV